MRSKVPQLDWNSYLQCEKRIWTLSYFVYFYLSSAFRFCFVPFPPLYMFFVFALLQADDVNRVVEERSGRLPLHIAADFGQEEVMVYLIAIGADINVRAPSPVVLLGVSLTNNCHYFRTSGLGSDKIWHGVLLNSTRVFLISAFFISIFFWRSCPRNFSVAMCFYLFIILLL